MNAKQRRRALAVAKGRAKVLAQWHEVLESRGEATKDQVTNAFLARLARAGKVVSRSTLYSWEERETAGGLEGLIDGRAERAGGGPKLLTFDLPGVKLSVRVKAARVDIREGPHGLRITMGIAEVEGASKAT